jgi:hypothetical protein
VTIGSRAGGGGVATMIVKSDEGGGSNSLIEVCAVPPFLSCRGALTFDGVWVLGAGDTNEGREEGVSDHLAEEREEEDVIDSASRGMREGKVGDSASGGDGGVSVLVSEPKLGNTAIHGGSG